MADLKVALDDVDSESISGKQMRQAPLRGRWTWVALLLPLAGWYAWWTWHAPTSTEPLRAEALTTFPGLEHSPSFSPDGNHVVFTWTGPKRDNEDIYVQQIGAGSPLPLTTHPDDDYNPVWSPDGKQIAFLRSQGTAPTGPRNRELWVIAPLGGSPRKLADVRSQDFYPFVAFLAWSPDSRFLVVTDSQGEGKPDALFVISVETALKRRLTEPPAGVLADTSPAVSPDGRSLAFLRRTNSGSGELHLLTLGKGITPTGQLKRLTPAALRADFPAWMPDSKEIVYAAKGSLWRLVVSGKNSPTRIAYVGEDGLMPAISRPQPGKPARLVYVHNFTDFDFWRIETSAPGAASSSPPVMAIGSTKMEYHIRFSPDGRRVAFTSARSGDPEIYTSSPDGSDVYKLTSMVASDTGCPDWSPDGKLIAFTSTADGEYEIYTVPSAGGKPLRLTTDPAMDICPRFSPDGKSLYFSSMRSGDFRIWKMSTDGGEAVPVTPNQGGSGAVEVADGSIYYNTVSTVGSLWRLPASGGQPNKVLDGIVWFNWCLIEKGIYYIDKLGGENRLQYRNFATGKSTTVASNLGAVTAGLTATPNGKTILFTRMGSSADDLMLVENFR